MSLIIKIKNKKVVDIPSLIRLVLRYIYEKDTMKAAEITLMEESIVGWSKKVTLDPDIQFFLQRMGWMLKKNEEGHFDRRKELFAKHKIDWRKYHRSLFYDRGNKRIY